MGLHFSKSDLVSIINLKILITNGIVKICYQVDPILAFLDDFHK